MRFLAVSLPLHKLLSHESDGYHQELQVKPVVPEPNKQVGTEDDRERAEAENVLVTTRPAQEHVKPVGEKYLGDQ